MSQLTPWTLPGGAWRGRECSRPDSNREKAPRDRQSFSRKPTYGRSRHGARANSVDTPGGLDQQHVPRWPPSSYVANRYLVTLRLRALANSALVPALDGVKADLRKAVRVVRDPDLLPGFPI